MAVIPEIWRRLRDRLGHRSPSRRRTTRATAAAFVEPLEDRVFLSVQYTLADLGTSGGTASYANAINNSGQIVGYTVNNSGSFQAFLYEGGSMTPVGTLGGVGSSALGINAAGEITGWAYTTNNDTYHAFYYADGLIHDLGALSGGTWSEALGINATGQIVGWSTGTNNTLGEAVLVSGGTMQNLGTLGGSTSIAFGINDSGAIVGQSTLSGDMEDDAFLFPSGGSMEDLGTLGGDTSVAYAINDSGVVVGQADTAGDADELAFRYTTNTGMVSLGTFGGTTSVAYAINNAGTIVGDAYTTDDASQDAFIYSNGTLTDLNSLINSNSGWQLEAATGINAAGQIVGYGVVGGQTHAFLLTPVNQPATPTGVTAQVTAANQITVSWQAVSGATSYNIYRSTASGTEGTTPYMTGITGTTFVDSPLTDGPTYYYQVTAVNSTNEGDTSTEVSAAPLALTTPATATSDNVGTAYSIAWTGGISTDTVQIWAFGGPSESWTELTTGVAASAGHYSWNTTSVEHGWYYFSAYVIQPAGDGPTYQTVSPNWLHVVKTTVTQAPTATLLNPVLAGEADAQGTTYTISWTTTEQNTDTNPLFVQLWVYSGDTNQWSILPNANSISTGASGSYMWTTTNVLAGWYSFTAHITDGDLWGLGGPEFNSPGWVNITVPTPTITYLTPTNGQTTTVGGTFNLNWSISGLPDADLANSTVQLWAQYLNNSGTAVWAEIAVSVNAAAGTYAWTVPTSPGAGTYYAFSMWMNYGNDWWIQASPNWVQAT